MNRFCVTAFGSSLVLCSVLLIRNDAFAEEADAPTKAGVADLLDVASKLGKDTLDATLGEVLVRAYPSRSIVTAHYGDPPGSLELSCDTYRSGAANHYSAAATACHVQYHFVATSRGYTLSGPFKAPSTFKGSSCEQARNVCANYQVTLQQHDKLVEIREGEQLLGTVSYAGLAPQFNPANPDR